MKMYRKDQVDDKLSEIHETYQRVRENMSNPNYEPTHKEKRDLLEFFNIQATVWHTGHKPRFKIEANPVNIENTLS
jgi:ribosomal protein S10